MVRARILGKWSDLAWLVAVMLLVSGCSSPPASDTSSEYVELADSEAISYPEIENLMSICQQHPFAGLDLVIQK